MCEWEQLFLNFPQDIHPMDLPQTKQPQRDLNHEVGGEGQGAVLEGVVGPGVVEDVHEEHDHVHHDQERRQEPHDEVLHEASRPPLHVAVHGRRAGRE